MLTLDAETWVSVVYLRVTPLKGTKRFHVKGKLEPRFIGPFEITARRGEVAYQLELPPELSDVHNVFHVSQLRKCLQVPNKPDLYKDVNHQAIDLQPDLTYREKPIRILDEAERRPLDGHRMVTAARIVYID